MALILDSMEIKLKKVVVDEVESVEVYACAVKKSSDDASLRSYYEKKMTIDSEDLAELLAQFAAIEAQLKDEDSLE